MRTFAGAILMLMAAVLAAPVTGSTDTMPFAFGMMAAGGALMIWGISRERTQATR